MNKRNADKLLDRSKLQFGKYRGRTPEEIARFDPSYVVWLYNEVTPKRCSKELALACEDSVDDDPCPEHDAMEDWLRDEYQ